MSVIVVANVSIVNALKYLATLRHVGDNIVNVDNS